jgi:hypothetical protein
MLDQASGVFPLLEPLMSVEIVCWAQVRRHYLLPEPMVLLFQY